MSAELCSTSVIHSSSPEMPLKASCDIFSPASYPKTASWTKAADCCLWDGVACDGATREVIGLHLSCSWLQGTLHSNSTLFSLRSLWKLNLAGKDFGGSQISSRLLINIRRGQQNEEEKTARSDTRVFQTLSPGALCGNHEQLRILDLSSSNLSGALEFETMFSKLKNGILLWLPSKLRLLVQNNGNCSFPNLDINMIEGQIPQWLFSIGIDTLEFLVLSDNKITGVMSQFPWNCIDFALLSGDFLEGPLPALPPTTYLSDVSNNKISGDIPSSFCGVSSLRDLVLSNNNLSGTVRECFGNLTNLGRLNLGGNQLEGPLPRSLANCTILVDVDISKNEISDTFPYWLIIRVEISIIDLSNNGCKGPVPIPPPAIGFYPVSGNEFMGEITSSIRNATGLEVINLSNNSLSGTIPSVLQIPIPVY
ncbi:receptor-like protein Cf-9 homolog [Punica granatum]|uniref:Receptor-like protein Cf-9 homolog n=1 Tax=Punica granatum TaxID=22663 RepID=A0A6P8EH80_PUNGR|nr:receptor-like protein Cf-9 homolog [Punica granatum]XP_031405822.1 receptor-like protein Cf-9 homolog [Punica granatum]